MRTVLIEKRKAKKLTVADMAEILNKSRSYYYKIEAGLRNPTIADAKQIADTLESTVDELFLKTDWTDRPTTTKPPPHEKRLRKVGET